MNTAKPITNPITVVFPFQGGLAVEVAQAMLKSVREHMPGTHIVHLSDMETAQLEGTDEIRRIPFRDFIEWRCLHMASLLYKRVVSLDYDVIVQRDLTHVFDRDFGLAVTVRAEDDETTPQHIRATAPHNFGVFFQRPSARGFWAAVLAGYRRLDQPDGWLVGQAVMSHGARLFATQYRIIELSGATYNYTPMTEEEDVSDKACVHYKGERKHWMVRRDGPQAVDAAIRSGKIVKRLVQQEQI